MYWIHPDHLGGASVLVNSGGKVTNWYEYMPYGEMLMELSNQEYNNPYKYNGKEFDEATGYYYYGARYYDPKRSFWISVDPLAEITQSPYTYVWNDPVNFADPTGMMGERVGGDGPGDPKKRSFGRRAIDWIVGLFGRGVDKGYKSNVRLKANNTIQVGLPTKMSEQEYQTTCWDEGDTHYQQVSQNTLLTSKIGGWHERGKYEFILPQNFGGWSQDDTASDGLIYKGCLSCHADNGAFTYAVKNSSTAGIGKSIGLLLTFLVQPGGSSLKTTQSLKNISKNKIDYTGGIDFSDPIITFYHKGELENGILNTNKGYLSVGTDFETVNALNRGGKVWKIEIPTSLYEKWEKAGIDFLETRRDLDHATVIYNQEIRFKSSTFSVLQNHIK